MSKINESKLNNEKLSNQQQNSNSKNKADEMIVKQFQMLQNTVGNQKVLEMMRTGILPASMPKLTQSELNQSLENKSAAEEKLINKDRIDLMPKILKEIDRQKTKLKELKTKKQGVPIFANITVELNYVTIPGNKPLNLYHFTNLVNVDLSFNEINNKKKPVEKNRGFTVPITFSFLYDTNEIKAGAVNELKDKNLKEEKKDVKNDKENPDNKNKPDDVKDKSRNNKGKV